MIQLYTALNGYDAATVLRQLPAWFADYNAHHPHKALGMRSPAEFRQTSELRQAA